MAAALVRTWCAPLLGLLVGLGPIPQARAGEGSQAVPAGLRMRGVQSRDHELSARERAADASPAAEPTGDDTPHVRGYKGPTAVRDEPNRQAEWIDPRPAPPPQDPPEQAAPVTPRVPPPSTVRAVPEHIVVAVGLAPEAPGSREERELLDALEASASASKNPTTDVRRLRAGSGEPRRVCRGRRDDLVVMIGYVADRPEPVVLAHDCGLDRPLALRGIEATREPGLIGALWTEHVQLKRDGLRERRRLTLSSRARGGIIAGVATAVVGVAIGALVANALRKESVVITVRP